MSVGLNGNFHDHSIFHNCLKGENRPKIILLFYFIQKFFWYKKFFSAKNFVSVRKLFGPKIFCRIFLHQKKFSCKIEQQN